MTDKHPTHWEQTNADWPGFRAWSLIGVGLIGASGAAVLLFVFDLDAALQEAVVVGVGLLAGLLLSLFRLAHAFFRAPRRILEGRVTKLETTVRNMETQGETSAQVRAEQAKAETEVAAKQADVERKRKLLGAAQEVLDQITHAEASLKRWLEQDCWEPGEMFGADAWAAHKGFLAGDPGFSLALDAAGKAFAGLHGLNHETHRRAGADAWVIGDGTKARLETIITDLGSAALSFRGHMTYLRGTLLSEESS